MKKEQVIETLKNPHWFLNGKLFESDFEQIADAILALPLDVPSDEEIEMRYPTDIDEIKKQDKLGALSYEAEMGLRRVVQVNAIKRSVAKGMRDEIINKNK